MAAEQVFVQTFVYLATAVLCVPLAKRLGLGSVLGYLIGGILIGPHVLGLVGEEGQDVMHFAEFGVVMMLFLIGLELQPRLLWRLRGPILGLGGSQVVVTAAAIAGVGIAAGLAWQVAVAVGASLALSSTAIVLQTLEEKGTLKSDGGQGAFSVLLFQDIAVIPMLALFPLLATLSPGGGHHGEDSHGPASVTWVEGLPAWGQTLAVLAAVALIVVAGLFLVRPILRYIARARLREIFTAAALLLVIGIALLMTKVGLSPALGTFLAGVVLANSEYRHQLESDVEPFKGLLLGVFFIAVGSAIDFELIGSSPGLIAMLVGGLLLLKFVVLLALGRAARMGVDQNLLFAFALAQGGEFAFVLFSFGVQNGVVPQDVASPLIAAVAVTMALTPLLLLVEERGIRPRVGTRTVATREPDAIDEENPVIIAGFGNFGNVVGRLLRANGIGATVLEVRQRPGGDPAPAGPEGLLRGRDAGRPARGGGSRPRQGSRRSPGEPRSRATIGARREGALPAPSRHGAGHRPHPRLRAAGDGHSRRLPTEPRHRAPGGGGRDAPPGDARTPGATRGEHLPPPRRVLSARALAHAPRRQGLHEPGARDDRPARSHSRRGHP